MVFFVNGPSEVSVIRRDEVTGKVENIGRFVKCDTWLWDKCYGTGSHSWVHYETFCNEDKRAIIGLLDKLNGIDIRPISEMRQRWYEITGLARIAR